MEFSLYQPFYKRSIRYYTYKASLCGGLIHQKLVFSPFYLATNKLDLVERMNWESCASLLGALCYMIEILQI